MKGDFLDKFKLALIPTLKVHSWGGYGSQLFTAYLVLLIQRKFPLRKIQIVLHTSGVTRRTTEFDFSVLGVCSKQVEDFQASSHNSPINRVSRRFRFLVFTKSLLKALLIKIRLVVLANDDDSFGKISLWTFSIRGHYTWLSLSEVEVQRLYALIFQNRSHIFHPTNDTLVHYRLGDLITLQDKNPISPTRIRDILTKHQNSKGLGSLVVLTDSPIAALLEFVGDIPALANSSTLNCSPLETISNCVRAEAFIGTNAKISLWATIFRLFLYNRKSSLPRELEWSRKIGVEAEWY
jgi:hypothetical protein